MIDGLAQRADFEPIGVLAERVEKSLEPAVLVNVLFGLRPGAELLAVVAETDDWRGKALGNLAEIANRLMRFGKRNRIAQLFTAGENLEQTSLVLGEVIAVKLLVPQTGAPEMMVVKDRIFDPRARDVRSEILLPNAFGHPHAANFGPEKLLQIARVGRDLADAVMGRNSRQDRLVKRPADDLELAALGQGAERVDVLAVRVNQPFQQAAGNVQRNGDVRIILDDFQKGSIAVAIGVFENALEIADR